MGNRTRPEPGDVVDYDCGALGVTVQSSVNVDYLPLDGLACCFVTGNEPKLKPK